ncbi:MAG: hypothetical protein ACRDRU_21490 [Pseudonocardiaceae bacterium]
MFGLRREVIALVASAALVLVLVGVSTGVLTIPAGTPGGQPASVYSGVAGVPSAPVDPGVAGAPVDPGAVATRPAPVDPGVAAPHANPVDLGVTAPRANPADPAVAAPRANPVDRKPVARPTGYGSVPVQRQPVLAAQQPVPIARQPVSVAPDEDRQPVSPPPPRVPAAESKSRTVITEPCCDSRVQRVRTHWDPPRGE